jgi:hypothetical protein
MPLPLTGNLIDVSIILFDQIGHDGPPGGRSLPVRKISTIQFPNKFQSSNFKSQTENNSVCELKFGFEMYLEIGLWKFERCASPEKLKTGSTDRTNGLLESPGRAEFPRSQWGVRRADMFAVPAIALRRRIVRQPLPSVRLISLGGSAVPRPWAEVAGGQECPPSLLFSDLSCVARAGLHNQPALLLLC